MKIYSSIFAMAAIAVVGLMSSCSSDSDVVADTDGDDSVITNKTITATFGTDDSDDEALTRLGGEIAYNKDSKYTYFKTMIYSDDDYFWVYASDKDVDGGWFNKLAPQKKETSNAAYKSVSGSTVKFVGNKLVYVIYSALDKVKEQDAHALSASSFMKKDGEKTILTFEDKTESGAYNYNLAYVYGDPSDKTNIPYTDKNNPYSFRIASAVIGADGSLLHYDNGGSGKVAKPNGNPVVNDEHGTVNLVNYVPKLRFSIPVANADLYVADGDKYNNEENMAYSDEQYEQFYKAAPAEVKDYLSKLQYKIIVDAVPSTVEGDANSLTGYPSAMSFRLLDINLESDKTYVEEQRTIVPNGVTAGTSSLKLYYGTTDKPSTLLWNTNKPNKNTSKKKIEDYSDYCTGDVYVALPPVKYKRIRVLVNVSYAGSDNAVKTATQEYCKTYKMDIQQEIDKFVFDENDSESEIKAKTSAVYDLGSIWKRTTFFGNSTSGSSAKTTRAVQPGNGWEIVDDSEFDF